MVPGAGAGANSELPVVLWDAFNSTSKPYHRLLDLVIFSPDYNKNRPDGLTATGGLRVPVTSPPVR